MRRFRFTIHNMIGHPLMEVLHLIGLDAASQWIHDVTLPKDDNDGVEAWDRGEHTGDASDERS